MNRWDWLRGAAGVAQGDSTLDVIARLEVKLENYMRLTTDSLAAFQRNLENSMTQIFREEVEKIGKRLTGIEERLAVLESIIFEPDPDRRQRLISEETERR